jgi:hypothetical protein
MIAFNTRMCPKFDMYLPILKSTKRKELGLFLLAVGRWISFSLAIVFFIALPRIAAGSIAHQLRPMEKTAIKIERESIIFTFTPQAQWKIENHYELRNPTDKAVHLKVGLVGDTFTDDCSTINCKAWISNLSAKIRGALVQSKVEQFFERDAAHCKTGFCLPKTIRYYDIEFAPNEAVTIDIEYTNDFLTGEGFLGDLGLTYYMDRFDYWNGPIAQWELIVRLPERPTNIQYAVPKNTDVSYTTKAIDDTRTITLSLSHKNFGPLKSESRFVEIINNYFSQLVAGSIMVPLQPGDFENMSPCPFHFSLFTIIEPHEGARKATNWQRIAELYFSTFLVKQEDLQREIERVAKNDSSCDEYKRQLFPSRCYSHDEVKAIDSYSNYQLRVCRNLPFAIHGRRFKNRQLNDLFYQDSELDSRELMEFSPVRDLSNHSTGKIGLEINFCYSDKLLRPIDRAYIKAIDNELERRRKR